MRFALLLSLLFGGCGAPQEPTTASDQTPSTPGQRCLEDARAARAPAADAPSKVSLRHILVRHTQLSDPRGAVRSPEEACLRALSALKKLQSGGEWDDVVAEYSDSKDDDLGRVAHEDLAPAFADAAFSLTPNELSYVVESDRGFHIILRR